MADFWIKVEKSTPDKAEIFEMAALLDIDPDAVLGKLIRVWSWIDSNSEDGHIKSVTHVLIDRVTNCGGFSKAMMDVGWLGETEVPNFDRHLGENAKKRAKDAERKRKSRNSSKECPKKNVTENGLDKSRVDIDKDKKEIVISNNEKPILKNENEVSFNPFHQLGFSDEQIKEIIQIRKTNKGKPIKTQRVINSLAKEFHEAMTHGMNADSILSEWATRGWQSFKAEWAIKNKQQPQRGNWGNTDALAGEFSKMLNDGDINL